MTVGVIQHDLNDAERQVAYAADITYGTNNEFGFDYLRDNMKFELAHYVQRGHHFAIVDEVDSILIDEARTPLIISGPAEESTDLYYEVDRIIPRLKAGAVDPRRHQGRGARGARSDRRLHRRRKAQDGHAHRERHGQGRADARAPPERRAPLRPGEHAQIKHHVDQALRAHALFKLDVDYMVKDGEVVIVDEFTGRLMPGRRWSDGLHQAVEAKEKVKIERENQTLATITFQNYFRMYKKLAGMTGTADTEAEEFAKIYKLDVVVIPPNRPLRRVEKPDVVYRTERGEVGRDRQRHHRRAQEGPAGARRHGVDREVREALAMLDRRGLKRGRRPAIDKHVVLNAKYHAQEAEFVAQAGRKGAVTIATNMAGRGTDILLGGNPEFMARQQCSPKKLPSGCRRARSGSSTTTQFVYFFHLDAFYRVPKADYERIFEHFKRRPTPSTTRSSASAACTSSAPSGTRRGASTTSCAAAPAARATPGRRASTCRSKTT